MLLWTLKVVIFALIVSGVITFIVMFIEWRRMPPPAPITDWQAAFTDSRAKGHNTDAYTFQIAWAYAQQHFEAQERTDGE